MKIIDYVCRLQGSGLEKDFLSLSRKAEEYGKYSYNTKLIYLFNCYYDIENAYITKYHCNKLSLAPSSFSINFSDTHITIPYSDIDVIVHDNIIYPCTEFNMKRLNILFEVDKTLNDL